MKKTILSIALVIGLVSAANVSKAQNGRFSVGAELALPMGDFGDQSNLGFGGSLRYEYPMGDNLGLCLTAGYITFSGKSIDDGFGGTYKFSNSMIPIQAGLKYYFSEQQDGFYGMVNLGVHSFKSKYTVPGYSFLGVTVPGYDVSASTTNLSYAPEIGYHLANADFGVRYQIISTTGATTSYVGIRIAYVFGEK
jgi:hypothetical protein